MKLRFKGNSIRLRLGQSEVRRLASEGMLEDFTHFIPGEAQRFGYALRATFEDAFVSATFADGRIVIHIPAEMIIQWAISDQVGIDAIQDNGHDGGLRILIEKDFECIDGASDESQEDAFPHPELHCA